jgi:hypothetical protein
LLTAGTLTRFADDLRSPNDQVRDEAARYIWEEYSERLAAIARKRLSGWIATRENEEDVLQNMFKSFCRLQQEASQGLRDRDELWGQLVLITVRKVANVANRHTAACRDVRREVRSPAESQQDGRWPTWTLDDVRDSTPSPDVVIALEEELKSLLSALSSEQKKVAILRMDGYTNEEIAKKVGRSVSAVELKFKIIRERLKSRLSSLDREET